MKRIFILLTVLTFAAQIFADAKRVSEDSAVITSRGNTVTAVPAGEAAPAVNTQVSAPYFGAMTAVNITCCARDMKKPVDWQTLSPIDLRARWYYKIKHKDKPAEILDIVGLIDSKSKINGQDYYFYCVPVENKGNLIRFTPDGAYLRRLKYPVFSWVFLDVELEPEIKYMNFPMKAGDEWSTESTGVVTLLGLFKVKQKTSIKFTVVGESDIPFDGRTIHVYKVVNEIQKEDGKKVREENWFALGIGLIWSNTETYTLELMKYTPGESVTAEAGPVEKSGEDLKAAKL